MVENWPTAGYPLRKADIGMLIYPQRGARTYEDHLRVLHLEDSFRLLYIDTLASGSCRFSLVF